MSSIGLAWVGLGLFWIANKTAFGGINAALASVALAGLSLVSSIAGLSFAGSANAFPSAGDPRATRGIVLSCLGFASFVIAVFMGFTMFAESLRAGIGANL